MTKIKIDSLKDVNGGVAIPTGTYTLTVYFDLHDPDGTQSVCKSGFPSSAAARAASKKIIEQYFAENVFYCKSVTTRISITKAKVVGTNDPNIAY